MRFRISHPLAIDDETIFVATGRERGVFPPISRTGRMQHFGFGLPRIEGPRHAHRSSGGMREFKVDGHQVASGIRGVVVSVCVFHGGFLGDGKWLFADRCSISRSHDARGASFLLWGVTLPTSAAEQFSERTICLSANALVRNDKFLPTVRLTDFSNSQQGFS